ncbi:MAG: alpha/beta hydrolase family protein [Planctomycetota bacterium]
MAARWATADDGGPDALVVDFPFGLGEYVLVPRDGVLQARPLADSPIGLRLERPADPSRGYESREVTFETPDGLTLHGTLFLPGAPPPHAAIVVLHGSANQGREQWAYRSWGPLYARMGLAALVYDRRPADSSPDLADLAADARAAHAWLAAREEVDAASVGFGGGSQAAWLGVSVAGDRQARVAFLILSGWPAVTPREQELQSLRNGMLDDGIDPEHVEAAVAYTHMLFYVARTGRLWPEFEPLVAEAAATKPWGDYVNQPRSLEDLAWWSRNMDFGGEKDLLHVRCPVLALYGEADWIVPPAENADRLRRALTRAGNEDVQVAVFPQADHRGEVPFGKQGGIVRWPQLAPGWLETIDAWVRDHDLVTDR